MVPDGWHTRKLGELFQRRQERGTHGLPTLSVTLNDGLVLRDSLDRKTDTSLSPEEHLLVRKGDIAYNMMRMWQGASGLASFDAIVSPAYVVLEPKAKHIDPLFAAYFLKSARTVYLLWAYSYGLTKDRLRLYFEDFALIPVVIPSLDEQRRIAKIVKTWDRAIETVEKLIHESQSQQLAIMQQFLTGKHRLPGFHRPWTPTKIAALGSFRKGKGLSRDQVGTEGLPCVLYGDLYTKYDHTVRNLTSFIPAELADSSQPIHTGDLLFTASGETAEEIGKCVAYLGEADAYAGGDVLILTPRKDDSEYLGYVLNHAAVIRQRVRVAQGHSVVHITAKHLGSISIELPDRQEQCALASLIADADRVTRNYVEQRDRLVTERESLLQQLLTGKWRVKAGDGAESLHAAR